MITRELAKEKAFEADWYLVQALNPKAVKLTYRKHWEDNVVTNKQIDKMYDILTELEAAE